MEPTGRTVSWAALAIFAITAALYAPVLDFEFASFDDRGFVVTNPLVNQGLVLENVGRVFEPSPTGNWQPLTWLSHMIDVELFDLRPGGHHATGALIHSLNAALLLLVLFRLTGVVWPSAVVALLFAVHPLHVESVAWISERKDVLSTAFGLLALLAYTNWVRTDRAAHYVATSSFMALSLLSKPTLVTLPFVLLLLDFWPLQRWSRASALRRVTEKLPLFALAMASSAITLAVQGRAGAFDDGGGVGWLDRTANAAWSYGVYLRQTFWPVDLAVFYPHPYILEGVLEPPAPLAVLLVGALLIAITVACARMPQRYAIVGWLWFLGTLVPMIGIVQVGGQAHADRYTYVPLIGLFIGLVWGAREITARLPRAAVAALAIGVLCALSALSWQQIQTWRDGEVLLRHALAVNPRNPQVRWGLALHLERERRPAEALEQLRLAVESWPEFGDAYEAIARIAAQLPSSSDGVTSVDAYRFALRGRPGDSALHERLADALVRVGEAEQALPHYRAALANPSSPAGPLEAAGTRHRLARALLALDREKAAIRQYRLIVAEDPFDTEAAAELADLLSRSGDPEATELRERELEEPSD